MMDHRSSLGCCHAAYGGKYYRDAHYPAEPFGAWTRAQLQSTKAQASVASTSSSSTSSTSGSGGSGGSTVSVASYDSPKVFYPRGGNAECVWQTAYHTPVTVTDTTKQIGIATATW